MNNKRLYKSNIDRKILGVCGGIAEYFNIDPTIVRLVFILLFFAKSLGFGAYLIAAFIMPESNY